MGQAVAVQLVSGPAAAMLQLPYGTIGSDVVVVGQATPVQLLPPPAVTGEHEPEGTESTVVGQNVAT